MILYTVKKLEWRHTSYGAYASTMLGKYVVRHNHFARAYAIYFDEAFIAFNEDREAAKAAAETHHLAEMEKGLVKVDEQMQAATHTGEQQ